MGVARRDFRSLDVPAPLEAEHPAFEVDEPAASEPLLVKPPPDVDEDRDAVLALLAGRA